MNKPINIVAVLILNMSLVGTTAADEFGDGSNTFSIDFVMIGNPGNVADTTGNPNPAGSVSYNYRMGQLEISEHMIDKANAEGGLAITITVRGPNKPATSITWVEAARFVNWLNTSTGNTAAYKFEFQPGEAGYSLLSGCQLWDPGDAGYDPNNLFRNSQAKYFLPSFDEWYKAAYYDPTSGNYFDYPTGSNTAPTPVASGTTPGTAVYGQTVSQGPADVSLVGGPSPYGTRGQGGNVFEWEESEFDLVNDSVSAQRGYRGGFFFNNASDLKSSIRNSLNPVSTGPSYGFRVAGTLTLGDANGDGLANFIDVSPFLEALFDRTAYNTNYPGIDADVVLDINSDGVQDFLDVTPFLGILLP